MKAARATTPPAPLNELEAIVRSRLRQIQRQPELINALLGRAGLIFDPPP